MVGEYRCASNATPGLLARSWSAHVIGGKKMQLLGYIEAVSEAAAIERAVILFSLDDERRKRLGAICDANKPTDDWTSAQIYRAAACLKYNSSPGSES
jgi:hypothetical protein